MGKHIRSTSNWVEAGSSRLTTAMGTHVAKSNWVEVGSSRLTIAMGTHSSKIKQG